MTTSIFIRSWRGDREWLRYCLLSLKKFAVGFAEIIVVLPKEDELHFDKFDFHGAIVKWVNDPPNTSGYLSQQISKLYADTMTQSEWIMYVDSDCFAKKEFRPSDFFTLPINNSSNEKFQPMKGIQLLRHWSEVADAKCWKEPTALPLGFEPVYETMAVMPLIYNRQSLILLRKHIREVHKKSAAEYIAQLPSPTFSEFNVLGTFSLRYLPYLYDWRMANPSTDGYCRPITQYWSKAPGGVEEHREEFERILAE